MSPSGNAGRVRHPSPLSRASLVREAAVRVEEGLGISIEDPLAWQESPSQARRASCQVRARSGEEIERGRERIATGERGVTR